MTQPENLDDATLEYAAQLIEEWDFSDLQGVWAKRKRDREDAALRSNARQEVKQDMARFLRAIMGRADLQATTILGRLAKHQGDGHRAEYELRDAWPLAWKGWVNIYARMRCNSNCIPPEVTYHIELTERGRAVLAALCSNEQPGTAATDTKADENG